MSCLRLSPPQRLLFLLREAIVVAVIMVNMSTRRKKKRDELNEQLGLSSSKINSKYGSQGKDSGCELGLR